MKDNPSFYYADVFEYLLEVLEEKYQKMGVDLKKNNRKLTLIYQKFISISITKTKYLNKMLIYHRHFQQLPK